MDSLRQMNITGLLVLFLFIASLVLVVTGQDTETSTHICHSSDDLRSELVRLISVQDGDLKNELAKIAQATSQCLEPLSLASSEWTLVFHGQAGVGTSVLDAYLTGKGIPPIVDQGCKEYQSGGLCSSHYRNNEVIQDWSGINQVHFVIYKNRKIVKQILFDGEGSNYLNWFQKDRIHFSDWKDLPKSYTDVFSINGVSTPKEQRHFFISHFNRGCPNSDGWFVALDSKADKCHFSEFKFPVFLYSSTETYSPWNSHLAKTAEAFDVYVKYL